jgi:hypothetical protein
MRCFMQAGSFTKFYLFREARRLGPATSYPSSDLAARLLAFTLE